MPFISPKTYVIGTKAIEIIPPFVIPNWPLSSIPTVINLAVKIKGFKGLSDFIELEDGMIKV